MDAAGICFSMQSRHWTLSRLLLVFTIVLMCHLASFAQPVGLYEFQDAGNLTAATIGNDLVLENANGTIASVAGVSGIAGDLAASVGIGDHFTLAHDIVANGGGIFVNQYTVLFDVFVPAVSDGTWRCMLQTNDTNSNDGEYFFRNTDAAIGLNSIGYFNAGVTPGNWYRVVFSVDLGNTIAGGTGSFLTTVVDESGTSTTFDHGSQALDGRHSLFPAGGQNIVYFFADNDGEDGELHVTQLAIYDSPLTGSDLTALGAPGTSLTNDMVLLGDVNLDGFVDLLDVNPFVDRITNGIFQAEADINQDGFVDLLDVGPFVALLTG